ncbi:MAG: putative toxin-antitoxin system toxin component, PIN family [Candidatus Kerfeldbacteria bacterium]|nr:putative toxin-antitoxin system toxin component, PIN family [Candidatus Kerfeldbacteria bacterium]
MNIPEFRVVADSNIYISSFVFGGLPRRFVRLAEDGAFRLYISDPILQEVLRILSQKFRYAPDQIDSALLTLRETTIPIQPRSKVTLVSDPDDDRILECALAAEANSIVTGDRDLLRLQVFENIPILTVRQFFSRRPWETQIRMLK